MGDVDCYIVFSVRLMDLLMTHVNSQEVCIVLFNRCEYFLMSYNAWILSKVFHENCFNVWQSADRQKLYSNTPFYVRDTFNSRQFLNLTLSWSGAVLVT